MMMHLLRNRLRGSKGTTQNLTPVNIPREPEPSNPLQNVGDDLLDNSSRNIGEMDSSTEPSPGWVFSGPSLRFPFSSVRENMTESMVEGTSEQKQNQQKDWILVYQANVPLNPVNLVKWVIIVDDKYAEAIDHSLRRMMMTDSGPNKYHMLAFQILMLNDLLIPAYLQNIENTGHDGKDFQMLFVILSNNRLDLYLAVMERLRSLDFPSACVTINDAISKGLKSLAITKTIQLSNKFNLAVRTWSKRLPFENLMVVGFDVYKAKGSVIGIGGMVSIAGGSYFSTSSFHRSEKEFSRNFNEDIRKCCNAYKSKKGFLPGRIVIFRNGVDAYQLHSIKMSQLPPLLESLKQLYGAERKHIPKLTFIVGSKKINSRMLSEVENSGPGNPPLGTFLENSILLPPRSHFYLMSQIAQEVVKPTSFFILHDTQGLSLEQHQLMTYKMCHISFDWSGNVVVPIPCILAYRLAFLIGTSQGNHLYYHVTQNTI